jgi:porin
MNPRDDHLGRISSRLFPASLALILACAPGALAQQPTTPPPPARPPTPPTPAAQPTPPATPPPAPAATPAAATPAEGEAAHGILPIPDYTGDFWKRSYLTGDWEGERTKLANKGVQIGLDWTHVLQSVVEGGRDENTEIGGTADLIVNLDLYRMGLVPGGLIKFRGETRYGNSVNSDSAQLIPVNTDALFPLTNDIDNTVPFTITDLAYYQFLSEHFGLFAGKIDTLDGDGNEFASGRGIRQFMNTNLLYAPEPLLIVPYSTLAAGVVVIPIKEIVITSSIMNTADSSTTTGFDKIGDGWTWASEADFQYRLGELPGGQNVGFAYAWNNTFVDFGQRFTIRPGEGLVVPTDDETWVLYWSAWQYLYTEEAPPETIETHDGRPDVQGIGLFARAGTADDDTNPVDWSLSGGIGARGLIPTRDEDMIGLGYFYNSLITDRLTGFVGLDDASQGLEAFYGLAITPAARLTFDFQWIKSLSDDIDDAVVLGARLLVSF